VYEHSRAPAQLLRLGVTMLRPVLSSIAIALLLVAPCSTTAFAGNEPGGAPANTVVRPAPAGADASKEEVEQLRGEVAEQKQTIEELKALVQRLVQQQNASVQPPADAGQLVNASTIIQTPSTDDDDYTEVAQKSNVKGGSSDVPLTAGWTGEHFYVRSPDGQFSISPYGYLDADYRAFRGDGAPSNTFALRRARFGFQGTYGKHFDFALLVDTVPQTGAIVRDVYVNAKPIPEFQIQAGQFKEPFSQDVATAATNLDFVERSLASFLYPSASSAFRSPGAVIHGDISGGVMQYFVGAFNGKGFAAVDTTNEPEVIGRLRFYPWKKHKDSALQGLALGGSIGHGRARGLSNELSYNAANPTGVFTFIPQFRVNGSIERYNGEFTYLKGPWSLRGEYDQVMQARNGLGPLQFGGLGFFSQPNIISKAWYLQTTYLLTGEKKPENGVPRVKHPVLGPETPGVKESGVHRLGAWELGLRYAWLHTNEPAGDFTFNQFTPEFVPPFNNHTDEITIGLNWYPNYWVRYMLNFNIDQLREPSTIGQVPGNYYTVLQRIQFRF
jgi:phosphate-selective porin